MKRLCTICARGGSKGVPDKNLRHIAGRPLIVHSVRHAVESGLFGVVAVSSDDPRILRTAADAGANLCIERPAELATDTANKLDAIRHAMLAAEAAGATRYDVVVDLCPTAPLRTIEDIAACLAPVESGRAGNVFSVTPAHRSPYFNLVEIDAAGKVRLSKGLGGAVHRRQDAPACYDMNASIYVWRRDRLAEKAYLFGEDTAVHVMPRERSFDIDTPLDFDIVELLLSRARAP